MMLCRLPLLGLVMLLGPVMTAGNPVRVADLARIIIESDDQASAATLVVGGALVRHGNSFIVSVTPDQLGELHQAGTTAEVIMSDVDLDRLYLVSVARPAIVQEAVDWDMVGPSRTLDGSRRIVQMSGAMAASLASGHQFGVVSLSRKALPIRYLPPVVALPWADIFPHDSLAVLVNQDSIYSYTRRLQDFYSRYVFSDSIHRARDWLVDKFRGFGYSDVDTVGFVFDEWGSRAYNVRVVKPGTIETDKVIIIGAHYDANTHTTPWICAPGADDNGSGVALMLEVARILAAEPLHKTVMFMAFSVEELNCVGASVTAEDLYVGGVKVEVMFNYDMVGFTADTYWDLNVHGEINDIYQGFTSSAAARATGLYPVDAGWEGGDNYPFEERGYPTVRVVESDGSFANPYYHTESDLCVYMDFPYLADVTRMALVSLAAVADAAYPVRVEGVVDAGDGQSLWVTWSDCDVNCDYMLYWGSEPGVFSDSVRVPAGECGCTIAGLQEGSEYHVIAFGETPEGHRALYGVSGSGTPLLYPRPPAGLAGFPVPASLELSLAWEANAELDFSHYNVYRSYGELGAYALYAPGLTVTEFVDHDVVSNVSYRYTVTAVDRDGYESALSESVLLYPATFDGGLVVADGFAKDHAYDPDQLEQEAWLDTILGGVGYGLVPSDECGGPVVLSDIGRYRALIWIDDDVVVKNITSSGPALDEFSQHGTDMVISGYSTFYQWAPKAVPTNHLLYREFGLASYDYTAYFDFVGASGQDGWPSVQIDPIRGIDEWPNIAKLVPRPGAQVILRFDSYMNLPEWENQPVGLTYETANGKRVLLSFPLYYLTPSSAAALMGRVLEYLGVSGSFVKGDLDHSGTIDIADLALLIDHLYISLCPLSYPELADMDTRPGLGLGDVFVLIEYLFLGGPAPGR